MTEAEDEWRFWSASERHRLTSLPTNELVLAMSNGALDDLTPGDRLTVLQLTAGLEASEATRRVSAPGPYPKSQTGPFRIPEDFGGAGLAIKRRSAARNWLGRHPTLITALGAAVAWTTVLCVGMALLK